MNITTSDPIADMLTRVRNAIAVSKRQVSLPYSKVNQSVAELLASTGFLAGCSAEGEGVNKQLVIEINPEGENARIESIRRLSKPGRREYVRAANIPRVKRGRGMVVLSTSKGMMGGEEARKLGLGGELICEVF